MTEICEFHNRDGMFSAALSLIQDRARTASWDKAYFRCFLSGGNTPKTLYARLAQDGIGVGWEKVMLFWGDERFVPPDHPDSNYLMVKKNLLDKINIPASQVFPMATHFPDPATAAADYEQKLRGNFAVSLSPEGFPEADLVLLGMGPDGHTASLFPGHQTLDEKAKWVLPVLPPVRVEPAVSRLTLSLPVINTAANVLFLITGEEKIALAKKIISGNTEEDLPAARICPSGSLSYFLAV